MNQEEIKMKNVWLKVNAAWVSAFTVTPASHIYLSVSKPETSTFPTPTSTLTSPAPMTSSIHSSTFR